jgi:Zn-dependent protease
VLGAEKVGDFAIWYVVFLFTLTLHEGAHALVAWLGGDDTAYRGGQVSLNPWPHVRREPFGTVVIPLLTFMWSGWMMGWASAPYDPAWGRRYPRRLAAMSAAGPAANFLLLTVVFVIIKILLGAGTLVAPEEVDFSHVVGVPPGTEDGSLLHAAAFTLSVALNLNLLLFLFNLIPLPPLDGSGVLQGLLPGTAVRLFDSLAGNPMLSIFGLLVAWRIFGYIFRPAFGILLVLLYPDVSYQ